MVESSITLYVSKKKTLGNGGLLEVRCHSKLAHQTSVVLVAEKKESTWLCRKDTIETYISTVTLDRGEGEALRI